MGKAGFSGKPHKGSVPSLEDIPEALRDNTEAKTRPRKKQVFLIWGLIGLGAFALIASLWYFASAPQRKAGEHSPASASSPAAKQSTASANPSSSTARQSAASANLPASNSDTLLGHLPYPEAPASELKPITADGSIKLRKAAAKKFEAMVAAARESGVVLVPISGFRSIEYQQHVFFDIKAQRDQTARKRAEVSAPPGYSEHHTGYAADIGDGAVPAMDLNPNFDKTRAFKWLQANAARFNFEMSFPKNNSQGVSYEPWHWRFVGDRQSLETFYRAKSFTQKESRPSP
jgi:D-alanyl-D-alanine carboxypeptidase